MGSWATNIARGSESKVFEVKLSVLHSPVKRMCLHTRRWYCIRLKKISSKRTLDVLWTLEQKMPHTMWWIGFIQDRHTCILLHLTCTHTRLTFAHAVTFNQMSGFSKVPHGSNECRLEKSQKSSGIPASLRRRWFKCEAWWPTCHHACWFLELGPCRLSFFSLSVYSVFERGWPAHASQWFAKTGSELTDAPYSMLDKERDKVEKKIDGLKKSEGGASLASDRSIWGSCLL